MSVATHTIAAGDGWQVHDVICTHGPQDRPFEEQHGAIAIAAVTAGTFQYRTRQGAATLVPGGLLLGNHGACFECGHAHGVGDRCLAFHFTPSFFEAVAADIPGARSIDFKTATLPPSDATLPLLAEAEAARDLGDGDAFEELALRLAGAALTLPAPQTVPSPGERDARRISEAVRRIEADPAAAHSLAALARGARMSAYHFLRTFRRVAGMTPHQFVLRARLTQAAQRLRRGHERVTSVALEAGFNDLSTFNRRFRRLMGATPRLYRARFQNR
ncbi:AraC family transcriptional regulator [Microbacteriaceae bacterium K1510]|nr:AraC family transcriptional regulator [Microbacteriaceae bacterium K1510]